jgi:predicted nucleic acid-binding protein
MCSDLPPILSKGALHQLSLNVIQAIQQGQHELVASEVLRAEIEEGAPTEVLTLYEEVAVFAVEEVATTERVTLLADAYVAAREIGARRYQDALHVAFATIAECDALLSWDTEHIVTDWRIER